MFDVIGVDVGDGGDDRVHDGDRGGCQGRWFKSWSRSGFDGGLVPPTETS